MSEEKTNALQAPEGMQTRPADWEDIPEMTRVANLDAEETLGQADTSENEFKVDWESAEFDHKTDSQLLLDAEGEMLGFAQVFNEQEPPTRPYAWMRMRPGLHDHPAGDFLLDWAEQRSRRNLDQVDEELRVAMSAHNVSGYEPVQRLFERHGMQMARRSYQMRIALDQPMETPQLPEGLRFTGFDPEQDFEAFFRASEEGFADHFGHVDEDFEVAFPRWKHYVSNDEGYDPELFFFVKEGDQIAGTARCRKMSWEEKDMGWINELSVLRPWRRKGVGKALLLHCFQAFEQRGKRSVGLGVDAQSLTGATKLYEKAGMHVHRAYDRYELLLRDGVEIIKTELDPEEQA